MNAINTSSGSSLASTLLTDIVVHSHSQVLCAQQTMPSGRNNNRTSQLHYKSYTVKKSHPDVLKVSGPVKPKKRISHPFLGLALAGVTGVCGRVDTDSVCCL
ncbi:hypothetical protein E2C01_013222 [Portunus trituberculatus]|uniref:Uncharacterized protein n=1 Tax=Portunus trituberculatus TaxID=210409 RepID=A0A5B7DGR6_PORTR|nr:hypothetical protein [Portunus trituberculatus]